MKGERVSCPDVISIIITYVRQCDLVSFFVQWELDFSMKFGYDVEIDKFDFWRSNCVHVRFPNIVIKNVLIDSAIDVHKNNVPISWSNVIRVCVTNNGYYTNSNCRDIVAKCPNLVYFKKDSVYDFELYWIMNHKGTQVINLWRGDLLNTNFAIVAKHSNVRIFRGKMVRLCDFVVDQLSTCSNLKVLKISENVYGLSVNKFFVCKKLRVLKIYGGKYMYDPIVDLSVFRGCVNLESVYLYECRALSDLSALVVCKKLRVLHIVKCSQISVAEVNRLKKLMLGIVIYVSL